MHPFTPPAIEVEALVKSYGEVEAVRGVSFTVAPGEVFGFLGPNGAGKSTTINVLCTLARPTSGTARVNGFDVVGERDAVRRHIGLVFQDPTLDGYLTAEQNLRLHAELYDIDPEVVPTRMRQMLEMVDLWDRRDTPVQTYSGGMRRRLEIARGLMHSPRVLFLDEPTIGLDPQTRSSIWNYIRALQEAEGTTIFMTTHYMDEAEFCDRIAIIDRGEIVVLDSPEALKASVGADRVVLGTADDEAALAALRDQFGIEATVAEGAVTFHVDSGEAFVPRLFAELGVGITSVKVARPTLDDVFMRYTGTTIRDAETGVDAGSRPGDHAGDGEVRPMSAAVADVVAVRVPAALLAVRGPSRAHRLAARSDPLRQRAHGHRGVAGPAAAVPVRPRSRAAHALGHIDRWRGPHDVHVPRRPLHGAGVQRHLHRGVAGLGPRARVPAGADGGAGAPVVDHRGQVPGRRHHRRLPGRHRAGPGRTRGRALRPGAAPRPLRPGRADRLHDHRLRRDGRHQHQAGAGRSRAWCRCS